MLACRELCRSTLLLSSLITSPLQTDPRFSLCRPLGLPLGFLRFPAISLGRVGKPGGGGICPAALSFSSTLSRCRKYWPEARHPKPEARSPSVGFLAFSAFSLGRMGKPGVGVGASGDSELSTRNSELGTCLPTCKLSTFNLSPFGPKLLGLSMLIPLAWIIHEVSSQKSKDALKG
jgi:hypothetical protein